MFSKDNARIPARKGIEDFNAKHLKAFVWKQTPSAVNHRHYPAFDIIGLSPKNV
jgi:hypothetical protein